MKNFIVRLFVVLAGTGGLVLALYSASKLSPATIWERPGQEAMAMFFASFIVLVLAVSGKTDARHPCPTAR